MGFANLIPFLSMVLKSVVPLIYERTASLSDTILVIDFRIKALFIFFLSIII
ncbi:hypothetical protein [Aquimarina hainanensis]|uniref:hypothetical protein n=1 Tax=Aquimarina hainanensis TaxID=1578017 RepID=UPI003622807E